MSKMKMSISRSLTGLRLGRLTRAGCVCSWLLLASGCSLLPTAAPVTFYRLPPVAELSPDISPNASQGARTVAARAITLRVKRPDTSGVLSGNRIAVIPQDNQQSAYEGVRWSASVPVLFRDQLIEALQHKAQIQHVVSDSDTLQADVELNGALRGFHTEYRQGQPVVVIRFDAQLVDPGSRTLLASRRFAVEARPQDAAVPAVVAAFGQAQARLANELQDWLLAVKLPPAG